MTGLDEEALEFVQADDVEGALSLKTIIGIAAFFFICLKLGSAAAQTEFDGRYDIRFDIGLALPDPLTGKKQLSVPVLVSVRKGRLLVSSIQPGSGTDGYIGTTHTDEGRRCNRVNGLRHCNRISLRPNSLKLTHLVRGSGLDYQLEYRIRLDPGCNISLTRISFQHRGRSLDPKIGAVSCTKHQ